MTAYGPPADPAGPPPPPAPRASFDPRTVDPLDWAILAGALLALIFSFFHFYSYTPKASDAKEICQHLSEVPAAQRGTLSDVCNGIDNSAWHGFFGWFGVLLLLVAAVLVALVLFAPQVSLQMPTRLVVLAAAVLGFICVLLALFIVPDGDYQGQTVDTDHNFSGGHGFSYWIVLALAVIVTVLCALRFQQTGGQLRALSRTEGYGPTQNYGGPPQDNQAPAAPPADYPQQQAPPAPPPSAPPAPPPGYTPPPPPPTS